MNATKISCQRELCKHDFEVLLPEPEIINSTKTSLLILPHPDMYTCPYCGQTHVFTLTLVPSYQYAFYPVELKAKSQIVRPMGNIPS